MYFIKSKFQMKCFFFLRWFLFSYSWRFIFYFFAFFAGLAVLIDVSTADQKMLTIKNIVYKIKSNKGGCNYTLI